MDMIDKYFKPHSSGIISVDEVEIMALETFRELPHLEDDYIEKIDWHIRIREEHHMPEDVAPYIDAVLTAQIRDDFNKFTTEEDKPSMITAVEFLYQHYMSLIPEMKVTRATIQLLLMDPAIVTDDECLKAITELPETPMISTSSAAKAVGFLKKLQTLLDPRYVKTHVAIAIRIKNYESTSYNPEDIPKMDENAMKQLARLYEKDISELTDFEIERLIDELDDARGQLFEGMDESIKYIEQLRKRFMDIYIERGVEN